MNKTLLADDGEDRRRWLHRFAAALHDATSAATVACVELDKIPYPEGPHLVSPDDVPFDAYHAARRAFETAHSQAGSTDPSTRFESGLRAALATTLDDQQPLQPVVGELEAVHGSDPARDRLLNTTSACVAVASLPIVLVLFAVAVLCWEWAL